MYIILVVPHGFSCVITDKKKKCIPCFHVVLELTEVNPCCTVLSNKCDNNPCRLSNSYMIKFLNNKIENQESTLQGLNDEHGIQSSLYYYASENNLNRSERHAIEISQALSEIISDSQTFFISMYRLLPDEVMCASNT